MNIGTLVFTILAIVAFTFAVLRWRLFMDTSKRYNAFLRRSHLIVMVLAIVLGCALTWASYLTYEVKVSVPCPPLKPVATMKYAANDDERIARFYNHLGERHAPFLRTAPGTQPERALPDCKRYT